MKDRITPAEPVPVLQETAPARDVSRRTEGLTHEIVVDFYRRMKLNRVFPLQVQFKRLADRHPSGMSPNPVQVRPMIPGAHVAPAMREVHLGNSDAVANFSVTPLARGTLRDAHVGIYQDGRLLEDVKLPMKGVGQRLTWILLLLTFLIPGLIRYFTVGVDLSRATANAKAKRLAAEVALQKRMPKADEGNMEGTLFANMDRGSGETPEAAKKRGQTPAPAARGDAPSAQQREMAQRMRGGAGRGGPGGAMGRGGSMGRGRGGPAGGGPAPAETAKDAPPPRRIQLGHHVHPGTLEYQITQNTPEPREYFSEELAENIPPFRESVAQSAQDAYEQVQGWETFNTKAGIFEVQPVSRYAFVILLGLTVISWIVHRSQRSRHVASVALAA